MRKPIARPLQRNQPNPHYNRSRRESLDSDRPVGGTGNQNNKRAYERYVALAQVERLNGDMIKAESYLQHAEHYYRLMFTRE